MSTAYKYEAIKSKITTFTSSKIGTLVKFNKKDGVTITPKIFKVLKYIETNMQNILIGKPNDLKVHIKRIEQLDGRICKGGKNASEINKLMSYIFVDMCYDSSNKDKKNIVFNKFDFIESLNINTCPYCNRNYIYTTSENKLKHEIDHFFPKTYYPYLAISYYNLIPSCKFCNQINVKGSFDTYKTGINGSYVKSPYDIELSDFKFTYFIQSVDITQKTILGYANCLSLDNKISIKFKKKIDANLKCFKLEELYKKHQDVVIELICKKIHYPKSYINDLSRFGFSKEEISRFLLCNYTNENDLNKRPLSKLIKDISDELKLI